VGDRRQELHFVGAGGDLSKLRAALDACLVRPGEKVQELSDPFPGWPSLDEYMAELEGTPPVRIRKPSHSLTIRCFCRHLVSLC